MICPSEAELWAFHLGELSEAQIECVGEHLAGCPRCEERTRTLDGSADTVLSVLRGRSAGPPPTSAPARQSISTPPAPDPPGYEALGLIGQGGMGRIYKARHVRLDRVVALKFLHAQGPAELARFDSEARAIARLQHPQIVQIFDVGQWHGQLFLALEYLGGGTLADCLNGKPQDPRAAAQLVQSLARTMHFAHERGIVHRDLKPANVLLQRSEVRGQMSECRDLSSNLSDFRLLTSDLHPKISDFGIAKHLRASGQTRAGDVLGTPGYMAPEQAGGGSDEIGPASDIYSLGVMLYEMLTGRVPLQGATDLETVLLVRMEEPVPPSRLRPGLPRDLETICLTCLHKEPARRYASAAALADDLGSMLAGEPIKARKASLWERSWKWARRRPAAAALAMLVALIVGVGFPGATYLWRQADHARTLEAEHRGRAQAAVRSETAAKNAAQRSEAEALATIDFLEKQILVAARDKHNGGLGREATLRQALDAALPHLNESFAGQPLIEARLRRTMGLSFRSVGDDEQASEQFLRAHELYIAHKGRSHRDTISTSINLAWSFLAAGRQAEAARLAEETAEVLRATPDADPTHQLWLVELLAEIRVAEPSTVDEGIKLRKEVVALREARFGREHETTLDSLAELAKCYTHLKRHAEAVAVREELLARRRAAGGWENPKTAEAMTMLVYAYDKAGREDDALRLRQERLDDCRKSYGPDDSRTLESLHLLASACAQQKKPAAVALYEELLKLWTAKHGADSETTLPYMRFLADCYATFDRHDESIALRELLLVRQEARLGAAHADTIAGRTTLAMAYRNQKRYDEEARHLEVLYDLGVAKTDSPHSSYILYHLAGHYCRSGRRAESLQLRKESLEMQKAVLGPDHPTRLRTTLAIVDDLIALSRGDEALPLIDDVLPRAQRAAVERQFLLQLLSLRRRHFQQIGDAQGCRQTAEMWEALGRNDKYSLYAAAKFRAVTAAVLRAGGQSESTAAEAEKEAERSMDWLRQAVTAGFNSAALLKFDSKDLTVLADREDFQNVLADLQHAAN